jgi:hypothetical protein
VVCSNPGKYTIDLAQAWESQSLDRFLQSCNADQGYDSIRTAGLCPTNDGHLSDLSIISTEPEDAMEFWVGLSLGMHLGRIIADVLEKIGREYGLLDTKAEHEIEQIEKLETEVMDVVEELR